LTSITIPTEHCGHIASTQTKFMPTLQSMSASSSCELKRVRMPIKTSGTVEGADLESARWLGPTKHDMDGHWAKKHIWPLLGLSLASAVSS
jgi:hypothetical protein